MSEPSPRTNYLRRTLGVLICFSPVGLMVLSLVCPPLASNRSLRLLGAACGLTFALLALLVGMLNAYIAFIRPALYRWRHGSLEGMRGVSVGPMLGSALVILAGMIGFGDIPTAVVGLIAVALDTGGLPWLLVDRWRDRSFWDE